MFWNSLTPFENSVDQLDTDEVSLPVGSPHDEAILIMKIHPWNGRKLQVDIAFTVLPGKSESDVRFCLQSYQGLRIDRSLVY